MRLQRTIVVGKVSYSMCFHSTFFSSLFQRAYHDLVTLPGSKPIVSSGTPGYSAVSGHRVTVFGCTGFLGRYLVSKLGVLLWGRVRGTLMNSLVRQDGHTGNCAIP